MSLDITLTTVKSEKHLCPTCGIGYIGPTPKIVYENNITHNLVPMAREAGLYQFIWRPDELNIRTAKTLIKPLGDGLDLLLAEPDRFKKFNAPNNWGTYSDFITFVSLYLTACSEYPDADIEVSR
jgi:hypothetical protein